MLQIKGFFLENEPYFCIIYKYKSYDLGKTIAIAFKKCYYLLCMIIAG